MKKKNENTGPLTRAALYIRETYVVNWCGATFRRMLSEELYTGVYNRGGRRNDNFCPTIISRTQYDRVRELLKRNARSAPSGRRYIFTSILKCAECEHNLVGLRIGSIYYYRCNQHFQRNKCSRKRQTREDYIENWLFQHLEEELERCKLDWEVKAAERRRIASASNKAILKRKLSKLKELYVKDLIDIDEYRKDYQIYTTALNQLPEPAEEKPPDFTAVEALPQKDFKTIYDTLTREEKRALWRSAIKEIRIDNDNNITGISFG